MLSVSILGIKENIKENIEKLDKLDIDSFHIDVMDGIFVENKTIYNDELLEILKNTRTNKDVHLMVKDIKKYIDKFEKINPKFITFHFEATKEYNEIIKYIKSKNIKVGISINPETKVSEIENILKDVDLVLIMSVKPGYGGQKFIENSKNKIEELYYLREKNNYKFIIEVDGGINKETKEKVKKADLLVVGSYITNNDYQGKIKEFKVR